MDVKDNTRNTNNSNIKLFEHKKIRSHWDAEIEEWCFSVVDVIGALTENTNPRDYFKKLRKRDSVLDSFVGTNCPPVEMITETGKIRKTLAGTPKDILRIVQSIPSKKAEPLNGKEQV